MKFHKLLKDIVHLQFMDGDGEGDGDGDLAVTMLGLAWLCHLIVLFYKILGRSKLGRF